MPVLVAGGATAVLLIADLAVRGYHAYVHPVPALRMVLNVGAEGNLASWWNSTLLLTVAATALLGGMLATSGARPGRPSRPSWLALAFAAAWLSLDETVQLHERLTAVGKAWTGAFALTVPTYAWVLPGSVLAAAGVGLAVLWGRGLPRDLRIGMFGALAVYLTGALVVEACNGWAREIRADLLYALGTTLEEGMEMGACLIALGVLARHVTMARDPATGVRMVLLRRP